MDFDTHVNGKLKVVESSYLCKNVWIFQIQTDWILDSPASELPDKKCSKSDEIRKSSWTIVILRIYNSICIL